MQAEEINQIIRQYEKHGWNLRCVLLSGKIEIEAAQSLFVDVEIRQTEIDALWFSRLSQNGNESWELRRLSSVPYALFESFTAEDAEHFKEETFRKMEEKLKKVSNFS